jgi:hypothetical protein
MCVSETLVKLMLTATDCQFIEPFQVGNLFTIDSLVVGFSALTKKCIEQLLR